MLGETPLEMVERHVREGQSHVDRQHELIASLPPDSPMTEGAMNLLQAFVATLAQHRAHLARMKAEQGQGVRDKAGERRLRT